MIIKHPHTPEFTIQQIDKMIAEHQYFIDELKKKRELLLNAPPIYWFPAPPQLTKELIRDYMRSSKKPVQTVEVVDGLFVGADQETKDKAVKTVSVIFNTLVKDGQVKAEKTPGVKGNFYTWLGEYKEPKQFQNLVY
jgi:hypothetical protein